MLTCAWGQPAASVHGPARSQASRGAVGRQRGRSQCSQGRVGHVGARPPQGEFPAGLFTPQGNSVSRASWARDVCDSGSPRLLLGRRKRNFSETGLAHPCLYHTLGTQKNGYRKEKSEWPFHRCPTSLLIKEMEIEMRFFSSFKLIIFFSIN